MNADEAHLTCCVHGYHVYNATRQMLTASRGEPECMHARMRDKSCAQVILDMQVYSNLFGHVGSTCGELCRTKKWQCQRRMCHLRPLQCMA